jgi:hypothetical protein
MAPDVPGRRDGGMGLRHGVLAHETSSNKAVAPSPQPATVAAAAIATAVAARIVVIVGLRSIDLVPYEGSPVVASNLAGLWALGRGPLADLEIGTGFVSSLIPVENESQLQT